MKELSATLLSKPPFDRLTESQAAALAGRLRYIINICDKIDAKSECSLSELEDIELDVWANIGAPESGSYEREISSWLIQTSWPRNFDQYSPIKEVAALMPSITHGSPRFVSVNEFFLWMTKISRPMRAAAVAAIDATDGASFVAHVMFINTILLEVLLGINLVRLTPTAEPGDVPDSVGRVT